MTANEFKAELKHLSGGYLFCGEEEYLKRHYLQAAQDAVTARDDVFNRIVFNADNYSAGRLMTAVESLPVMSDRKFITLTDLPFPEMREEELEDLTEVLGKLSSYEYNVLILSADADRFDIGTPKQPSGLFKRFSALLKPVLFPRQTPARLAAWTVRHFTAELIVAPPDAVDALIAACGCDMTSLSSEIEKLCWYLKSLGREKLTTADVALVTAGSREIAAFDFANAVLDGKVSEAFSILTELRLRKERPEIILGGISRVICDLRLVRELLEEGADAQRIAQRLRMHPVKVKLYVRSASRTDAATLRRLAAICYDADVRIKSTPLQSYDVLDRLTVQATMR